MGFTAVLVLLTKEETGVLKRFLEEALGPSKPCAYRCGGLNFVGDAGDELGRSGATWMRSHRRDASMS